MEIDVLVFDGFDELDAIGPYEVLANAFDDVRLAGEHDRATGSHGLTVLTDGPLRDAPDLLVVPGGGWNDRAPQGAYAEHGRGVLPRAIAARHAAGTTVAAVCTGAMLITDLLAGRPATTHHGAIGELEALGVDVRRGERVVDDGDVLTAGGVTSGIDLALHLVERFADARTATIVAREMEHERRRTAVTG